jgi:FeS assembly SUF system regulator
MIRLSRLTDYAIVILAELGREVGGLQAAAALADKTKIPEPTVAKVLKILARAGVLDSARGVNGGYQVVRPLSDISIGEVIEAMNGPMSLTACVEDSVEECAIAGTCLLRGRWDPVNEAVRNAFSSVKLADMIKPACGTCTHSHAVRHVG